MTEKCKLIIEIVDMFNTIRKTDEDDQRKAEKRLEQVDLGMLLEIRDRMKLTMMLNKIAHLMSAQKIAKNSC